MIVAGHPPSLGEREALERCWPNAERLAAAIAVARDVEVCAALLAGRPVDAARLDPAALERAKQARLVRLCSPIDCLGKEDAA